MLNRWDRVGLPYSTARISDTGYSASGLRDRDGRAVAAAIGTVVARTFTTEINPADRQAIVQDLKRQLEAIQNPSLAVERRDDQGGTLPLAAS
jgi:hypothetical protein